MARPTLRITNSLPRFRAACCAACAALCVGCHAAPPRYQTTWERAASGCYQRQAYCYGYSPTTWTRFPEHCAAPAYVVVEEVVLPAAEPVESPFTPPPLSDPVPMAPRFEIPEGAAEPQSATPPRLPQDRREAKEPGRTARRRDDADWTARLQNYWGEVTRWQ